VRENVEDINALNQTKGKAIEAISQVDVVAWKFWNKIKIALKDIVPYNKWLEELRAFKEKKSQALIEKYEYNEHTKFYKWINPRIIISEWWTYYISSQDESSSRIISYLDDTKKYTNQEVISTTDFIRQEFAWYWPLLVSFTLKDFLDKWWVLHDSDLSNRIFQFRHQVQVPITIENDTERIISVYAKYKSLFDSLYAQEQEISVLNDANLKVFVIYNHWEGIFRVGYHIDDQTNTIQIKFEEGNVSDKNFTLAILGIVIANGISLKKYNLSVERDGKKNPFEKFL
jgi:hypothetical protein